MVHHIELAVVVLIPILSCILSVHGKVSLEQQQTVAQYTDHYGHGMVTQNHQHQHQRHYNHHRSQHLSQQQRPKQKAQSLRLQRRLEGLPLPDSAAEVITTTTRSAVVSLPVQRKSTRLRRVSARDYYKNNVEQRYPQTRRGNTEWDYHVYNAHSNTFESPTGVANTGAVAIASDGGKGDDNTDDVEFISSTGTGTGSPDWANKRRDFGFLSPRTTTAPSTHLPPPLVPARRGYVTTAPPSQGFDFPHTTKEPQDANNIGQNNPTDPKEMEKRHICVQQRTITMPVKTTEVYTRPTWKHINTPCSAVQVQTQHSNQMCTRVQLVHEQAFRDVIRHKSAQQVTYDCCSGWERGMQHSDGCMKPVCTSRCQNGGICAAPDVCSCPAGFTGRFCEHDINECKEEKPCDQTCINTVGSYICKCRADFVLQPDQQSCKKLDFQDDDAFEARDLENEIESSDNEDVSARLHKIERSLANERVHTNQLQKSLQATYNAVDTLKSRLSTLEKQQHDVNRLQSNMYATETRTNKLEGMLNLLMKCRNGPSVYCP